MANKKEVIFSKEEQKNSNRIYKSATPKQTTDWYIKWAASGVLLTAMVIRSAGVSNLADTILSFIGCLGWLFVAFIWKDRALILLNGIACFILLTGIFTKVLS